MTSFGPLVHPEARATRLANPHRKQTHRIIGHSPGSEAVVDGLAVVAAEQKCPDVLRNGVVDEAYAAVAEAGDDDARVFAACLGLPVGPVVGEIVVGAAHLKLA